MRGQITRYVKECHVCYRLKIQSPAAPSRSEFKRTEVEKEQKLKNTHAQIGAIRACPNSLLLIIQYPYQDTRMAYIENLLAPNTRQLAHQKITNQLTKQNIN